MEAKVKEMLGKNIMAKFSGIDLELDVDWELMEISFKAGRAERLNEGEIAEVLDEARWAGYYSGIREVVEWMKQERQRHAGQHLGKPFEEILAHYYQHRDITKECGVI